LDIAGWLRGLGLEQYEQAFRDSAVDAEVLPELTDDHLKELGLPLGHRVKLLKAIAALRGATGSATIPLNRPDGPEQGAVLAAPAPPPAERRQLTVMFVDLVGSTSLAARLDPEDMREVITVYQSRCAEVIGHFEGFVAKFMGDGILAYFGWPSAHEDDAERAVRAALELIATVAALKPKGDLNLAARVGINTGKVVVGDLIGVGAAQEQAVVGETPNLAARIQSLAEPSTVVIGPSTRKLLGAGFVCEDLGDKMLAGVNVPVRIWRVVRPSREGGRFDAMRGEALAPLVGREEEVAILARRWELVRQGNGQVVVLSGEPGIGKSRLVRVLRERIAADAHTRLGYQCSPFQISRAFHPIIAQIEYAARFTTQDGPGQKLEKLRRLLGRVARATPDDLAVFAALLSLPGGERLPEIEPDPKQRKARILAAFLRQLEGLAAQRPVLCIFEDVHWSDPSTMDVFQQLVEWIPTRPVLLLVTCRPEFNSPWTGLAHSMLMSLSRMSASKTTELVARVAGGKRLPDEVVRQIVHKTDGIPLFVEELTRAVMESGILQFRDGAYVLTAALPALSIPATLHDSLMARLDRLPGTRQVAQLGAAIGRSFDYRLLSAAAGGDDTTLTGALAQLEEAGLLLRRGNPPDSSYSFKHVLIQDAAYGSLLRTTREDYHRRIAAAMERQSTDLAKMDAALLAHHYAEGGMMGPAIRYLRQAGETAIEASALTEAIENFAKGLALLEHLPESPERAREEIAIRLALGVAQQQKLGASSAEVEGTFLRALDLCERFGSPKDRFTALWGLRFYHYQLGNIYRGREYGDELLLLAEKLGDPALLLEAHHVRWGTMSVVGDPRMALAHTEEGLARYDCKEHHRLTFIYGGHDPGACARNVNAVMLCVLGYPEQAQRRSQAALALAHELAHPHTLGIGYFFALLVGLLVRNLAKIEQQTSEVDELIRSGKLQQEASDDILGFRGWVLAQRGSVEHGLALMRSCADWALGNAWSFLPVASMAAVLGKAGHADEGLQLIEQALHAAERGGAHWHDAEFYRVRANLHRAMASGGWLEAEKDLEKAIAVARTQDARLFELRAAKDLARLWIERSERQKAHDLLAPILDWFTEGFDTPDLIDAKACLKATAT
jgi:class 3 adenylate cyclase/tetratricopeptide (TPR) repeat protein